MKMKETLQEYPEDEYVEQEMYNSEEGWVYSTMSDVDEIIKKYGVEFFMEKLPRYSKIALLSWRKNANTSGCSSTGD